MSVAEATSVLQMYTKHKTDILNDEMNHSVPSSHNGVSGIQGIQAELVPAKLIFLDHYGLPLDTSLDVLVDYIPEGSGDDAGTESIEGDDAANVIFGGEGDDTLDGQENHDYLLGGNGEDRLIGDVGNDTLYGDGDSDELYGGVGDDTLYGGGDVDFLYGGGGTDVLVGDSGDDSLYGEGDNDTLQGGSGDDVMVGGGGEDTIWFGSGSDDVNLFELGDFKIEWAAVTDSRLSNFDFEGAVPYYANDNRNLTLTKVA